MSGFPHPVIDYRQFTGEYASASAVATVMGVLFVKADGIPGFSFNPSPTPLKGRGILVMGFGRCITAVEIKP
jgi:3-oxoacyl-[acyl-carrier-protein] synthase-1/3-oxoacyl-[acyl-carrier-protein] synthase II